MLQIISILSGFFNIAYCFSVFVWVILNYMLEIIEPVDVWVFFKRNLIQPHSFFWKGRQIKIAKVNLVHTSKEGANIFFHFSVSSGGNFYRLRLNTAKMNWILEAVEEE